MFDFFVLKTEWLGFVWIVLTSRIPQPASCGMRETFIFYISFVHTRIPQPTTCGMRENLYVCLLLVNPHPASHNLQSVGCKVIICLRFSLRIPASCTPQVAECGMWSRLNNSFYYFAITHSTSRKLRDAGCRMINKTCNFVFDPASRQTDLDHYFSFYSHLMVCIIYWEL